MSTLLISGYRAHDLAIFSDKDPRVPIIKEAIRRRIVSYLDEGVDWIVFTGNLGFEYWTLEVIKEILEQGYRCQLAAIFIFEDQGANWSEANQEKLHAFKNLDFVKYAFPRYEQPGQFKDYNQFLADNTDQALLFYDRENETNLKYLYNTLLKKEGYTLSLIGFDDLNELAENF